MKDMRLGVNVDHVATLRQQRGTHYPDPVWAAAMAELAGAHQITVHLREDRRHIQERDVRLLRESVSTLLNLEMAATDAMVALALDIRPDTVTLVPERREEQTTEGGLDVVGDEIGLCRVIGSLQEAGLAVSLFVDPDASQVEAAHRAGATIVELHTGDYCERQGRGATQELARLAEASSGAAQLGLVVAAGHGLDYHNVKPVAAIPEVEELNIGHSIVSRSVFVGFQQAVAQMLELITEGEAGRDS